MVISFDKPSGKHSNTGSCGAFVNYLEKENKDKKLEQKEQWFGHTRDKVSKYEVHSSVDRDHQGIGKNEGKFATGSINITEDEWTSLGKTDQEREQKFKQYAKVDFTRNLAENFNKKDRSENEIKIEPENINIYYKLEQNRYYKGTDEEVKKGLKKQGQAKDGFNKHIHFIVARKTRDGQNRISPTTKNRKEFDRTNLIRKSEQSFDKKTGYERPIDQSFDYANKMSNGTFNEKKEYLDRQVENQLKEHQKLDVDREKNIKNSQEQQRSREINLKM